VSRKKSAPHRERKTGRRAVSSQNSGRTVGAKKRGRTENLKPWKRGQSGNPGGRPRKLPLTDAARSWLEQVDEKSGLTNAERVAMALGKKALKGSHEAFRAIGDRAEGKPSQVVQLDTEKHDDVRELIEAMNKRYTDEQEAKEKKDKTEEISPGADQPLTGTPSSKRERSKNCMDKG
jgi:hypothetical protein